MSIEQHYANARDSFDRVAVVWLKVEQHAAHRSGVFVVLRERETERETERERERERERDGILYYITLLFGLDSNNERHTGFHPCGCFASFAQWRGGWGPWKK
jgi:hypothetical protein